MNCEEVIIIVENEQDVNIISQDIIEQVSINVIDGEDVIITVTENETINIISQDIIENIIITSEAVVERIIERNVNLTAYISGEVLGGQRLVMIKDSKAYYYDITDENNLGKFIGITNQSAIENGTVNVVGFGSIADIGWGLVPNAIYYAGLNGVMTITPPITGIFQRIGVAIDSNNFKIELSEPLIKI